MSKLKIGLYGTNGHQIQNDLAANPFAELAAVAAFDVGKLPEPLRAPGAVKVLGSLDELLREKDLDLISLCSPLRTGQATEAVRCLEAGKHVYAEKPCALNEAELDAVMETSRRTGRRFHEMAGTAFEQPFLEMRTLIAEGAIGRVIQVLAQKSYPYADWRPQDEAADGGLLMQVGIHALRYVEHVAGLKIEQIEAYETQAGNPKPGDLRMACSMMARLENGGLASILANYLNMPAFGSWGNECVRVFGTDGFIEAVDGGKRTRLVQKGKDCGALTPRVKPPSYFTMIAEAIVKKAPPPLSMEAELHPARMVIRARDSAKHIPSAA